MVADLTSREMLGAVIGLYRMAGDLGLLVGPVALGALAERLGFEATFAIAGACAIATLALGVGIPETLGAASGGRSKLEEVAERIAPAAD